MTAPAALDTALAAAINGWLGLDPETRARLSALDGRVIALHLRILELTVTLRVANDRIVVVNDPDLQPDTVLHGTPLGMARLGLGSDTAGTLFSGEVEITGDIETGQAFRAILDGMDIDWEEQVSRVTGDVVAHQLGNLARKTGAWLRHGGQTLEQDIGEYLQEESRVLPSRIEIENFIEDVGTTAMAVERLEARLQRLRRGGDRP
jgi:ubiquinone biosynthesis protein UbiJ